MTQATLFTVDTKADKAFKKFHEDNPKVYKELVSLAFQARNRGRRKIGMKMLFEVIRWNRMIDTNDPHFKVNNNYAPRYSRLIMDNHPELEGLFDLRNLRS